RAQEVTTMVAAASEEATTNVQSVASATEELSSSVNEISRQVQESARMAGEAVDQARHTNDRVSELSKAAARIGDVVELIDDSGGGGGAGSGDAGNLPQRAASRPGHPAGLLQHHRRAARRQRDRLGVFAGALGGAVALQRLQPAQARGRKIPGFGAGGLSA